MTDIDKYRERERHARHREIQRERGMPDIEKYREREA